MIVAVRGCGSASAAGIGSDAHWQTYLRGRITWSPDPLTGVPVYRVADLPEDDGIRDFIASRRLDRSCLLALHAAREAVTKANWAGKEFAVLVGSSRGPTERWEESLADFSSGLRLDPRTSPTTTLGSLGFAVADYFGTTGLASSLSVTCSSGLHAILHGVALLRSGMVERVLVGGAEAPLTDFGIAQLRALRIYAAAPQRDGHACRPFADPPSGMAIGEGAAFLALEIAKETDSIVLDGVGFGREQPASATGISRGGDALSRAMQSALASAGSAAVDIVVAHAPGTPRGDAAELTALQRVFPSSPPPAVTSLKWATGHTFGASGPLGAVAACDMLSRRSLIDLPYHHGSRSSGDNHPKRILVNATGFGGNAVSVILSRA